MKKLTAKAEDYWNNSKLLGEGMRIPWIWLGFLSFTRSHLLGGAPGRSPRPPSRMARLRCAILHWVGRASNDLLGHRGPPAGGWKDGLHLKGFLVAFGGFLFW